MYQALGSVFAKAPCLAPQVTCFPSPVWPSPICPGSTTSSGGHRHRGDAQELVPSICVASVCLRTCLVGPRLHLMWTEASNLGIFLNEEKQGGARKVRSVEMMPIV